MTCKNQETQIKNTSNYNNKNIGLIGCANLVINEQARQKNYQWEYMGDVCSLYSKTNCRARQDSDD